MWDSSSSPRPRDDRLTNSCFSRPRTLYFTTLDMSKARQALAEEVAQFPFMKTNLSQARLFCALALGIGYSFSLAAAAEPSADPAPAKTSIPWSQIGAKAGTDYQGDGLAVSPTAGGARLRCVFQRLEGEATREGLWLTSTDTNGVSERFRVTAMAAGRLDGAFGVLALAGLGSESL